MENHRRRRPTPPEIDTEVAERPKRSNPASLDYRGEEPEPPAFDYDNDLYIDPSALDAEWLDHSLRFMRYSKESARAKKFASFAEEIVKTKKAQLIKAANENPDAILGVGIKPTAPNVEAYYRDHPQYKLAKQDWIEAVYYADLMANAVFAFQARKMALENLVRLFGAGYNSGPQEPRDLPEAAERLRKMREQNTEENIRQRVNTRRD